MSMHCWLLGLSSAQIKALRATPSLVRGLVSITENDQAKAHFDAAKKAMSPEQRHAAEDRLREAGAMPEMKKFRAEIAAARPRLAGLAPFEQPLDLAKSWHILHYLMTGHVDPSSAPGDALLTGEPLGEDVGYGPARLHDERQTREFGRFLETQDPARLQTRVNAREMHRLGVYPTPFGQDHDAEYEQDVRATVAEIFPRLRDYVIGMSAKQGGLLTWIS